MKPKAGNKTSETLPDGELTTYGYDALNRLTSVLEKQGTTTLFSQNFILNPDGTRQSVAESQRQPSPVQRGISISRIISRWERPFKYEMCYAYMTRPGDIMSEAQRTPPPGTRLPLDEEVQMIDRIRSIFRVREPRDFVARHSEYTVLSTQMPIWMAFPEGAERITPIELFELPIDPQQSTVLFIETPRPGLVFLAGWKSVIEYFRCRAPWDRRDTYLLPRDLCWCIAYTHEDRNGTDVLLRSGQVPGMSRRENSKGT